MRLKGLLETDARCFALLSMTLFGDKPLTNLSQLRKLIAMNIHLLPLPRMNVIFRYDVHDDGYVGPRLGSEGFVLGIHFAHFTGCPVTRTAFLFIS